MLYEARLPAFVVQAVPANDDVGTDVVRWDKGCHTNQPGGSWSANGSVRTRVQVCPLTNPQSRHLFSQASTMSLHGSTHLMAHASWVCRVYDAETFDVGFARPNRSALKLFGSKSLTCLAASHTKRYQWAACLHAGAHIACIASQSRLSSSPFTYLLMRKHLQPCVVSDGRASSSLNEVIFERCGSTKEYIIPYEKEYNHFSP